MDREIIFEPDPLFFDDVLVWRFDQLFAAGYNTEQAARLAADTTVDLHKALELVLNGCTHEQAVEILL